MGIRLLATMLLLFSQAQANDVHRLADQRNIIFDRLGAESGLSQGVVTAFAQDDRGFIWIGTQEGLNKFDGFNFENFLQDDSDPTSLSNSTIWTLLSDSSGRLWVGTHAGLNLYESDSMSFSLVPLEFSGGQIEPQVYSLFEDDKGQIWVGTSLGIAIISGDKIELIETMPKGPIPVGAVRAMEMWKDGTVFLGSQESGLLTIDSTDYSISSLAFDRNGERILADDHIRDLLIDHEGNLWIATFNGGVSVLDIQRDVAQVFTAIEGDRSSLGSNRVRAIYQDASGEIWLGTDDGLHLWLPEKSSFLRYQTDLTDPRSISDNSVQDIFQDEGGVVWIGTYNGVSKWNATVDMFPFFKRPAGMGGKVPGDNISSFVEDEEGNIWIGTLSGLMIWDATIGELISLHDQDLGLSDKRVMSLSRRGQDIWVGTMAGGINILRQRQIVEIYQTVPEDSASLSSNAITRIYLDSDGRTWVATYGGGVNLYLGEGKFRRFPENSIHAEKAFSDLRALDLLERSNGALWISTDGGGVVILDPESGETDFLRNSPENPNSLSSDRIFSLLEADDGVWLGSLDKGLNFYNEKTQQFTIYNESNSGLANDQLYGILEDEVGNLWISGSRGLTKFNPQTSKFTKFDSSHGLQSSDFNSGAYYKASDGSLLFGGNNGFNAFYPSNINLNKYVPEIRLTSFSIFNRKVLAGRMLDSAEKIELNYDDSVTGFEFAALDYTAPEKNRYRYKLEGFDREWVDHGGNREVTYTNLDAGRYVFRVQGSNNDGVWNEEGASIPIVVHPAPWLTWWAYCIYVLLAALGFYLLLRANSDRLQREAERRYSERLQLYIESLEEASDCILIADSEGTLLYANNTITSGLNKSPAEVVGTSLFDVLFEDSHDVEKAKASLEEDGRFHGEVELFNDAGESIIHEVTIASVQQSSTGSAYVGISRDVTDRKLTEAELEDYRRNLERLVGERTEALQKEIAENKAIQVHLANSLQEKELLIKEVHHRVKNNMQVISSLLSIQAEGAGDEVYSTLLNESQQRIKSMALIHETLYQSEDLLKIDFQEYIESLTTSLSRSYTVPGVSVLVDVNVEDVQLDLETAVPCGLIINELASNALKHAFVGKEGTGVIDIDFVSKECDYSLRIADNGIGLSEGFDLNQHTSMGMEIVAILTAQLEGQLHACNDEGAVFEITFPRRVHG